MNFLPSDRGREAVNPRSKKKNVSRQTEESLRPAKKVRIGISLIVACTAGCVSACAYAGAEWLQCC